MINVVFMQSAENVFWIKVNHLTTTFGENVWEIKTIAKFYQEL